MSTTQRARGSRTRATHAPAVAPRPPMQLPGSAQWMISSLESETRQVAERVTEAVIEAVPGLDDARGGQLHHLILTGIHNAIRLFVDEALGREVSYTAVDDLFRKLGYREAARGREQEQIATGVAVALREITTELRVRAAENELSAGALNAINEAVTGFVERLSEQVTTGWAAGAEARSSDTGLARVRLLAALISGAGDDEVENQAAVADWAVPELFGVLALDVPEGRTISADDVGPAALTRAGRTHQPVVCAAEDVDEVLARLKAQHGEVRVARCWAVERDDVPQAWTWVNRALALVEQHVIPARPVIDCSRFRTEIWLHSEPALRRHLAQELLQPLFNETENSREILSETLLVWLETRDSAPAIAARLGVHPQTVRYRWKRINELFGEDLHDPEFVVQLTLVLKASVPLWLAGDQSDFQRYREGSVA